MVGMSNLPLALNDFVRLEISAAGREPPCQTGKAIELAGNKHCACETGKNDVEMPGNARKCLRATTNHPYVLTIVKCPKTGECRKKTARNVRVIPSAC